MIHKACMPVYIVIRKNCCGRDGWTGKSKVLYEVLADLKIMMVMITTIFSAMHVGGEISDGSEKTQTSFPGSDLFLALNTCPAYRYTGII